MSTAAGDVAMLLSRRSLAHSKDDAKAAAGFAMTKDREPIFQTEVGSLHELKHDPHSPRQHSKPANHDDDSSIPAADEHKHQQVALVTLDLASTQSKLFELVDWPYMPKAQQTRVATFLGTFFNHLLTHFEAIERRLSKALTDGKRADSYVCASVCLVGCKMKSVVL